MIDIKKHSTLHMVHNLGKTLFKKMLIKRKDPNRYTESKEERKFDAMETSNPKYPFSLSLKILPPDSSVLEPYTNFFKILMKI